MGSGARPIQASPAQRLAAQQAPGRQGQGHRRPVLGQRQHRVMRATRMKAARRRQPTRHKTAVGQHGQQQQPSDRPLQGPWKPLQAMLGLDTTSCAGEAMARAQGGRRRRKRRLDHGASPAVLATGPVKRIRLKSSAISPETSASAAPGQGNLAITTTSQLPLSRPRKPRKASRSKRRSLARWGELPTPLLTESPRRLGRTGAPPDCGPAGTRRGEAINCTWSPRKRLPARNAAVNSRLATKR